MKESQNRIHYLCVLVSGANLSCSLLKWDLEYDVSCTLSTGDQDWTWTNMIVGQTAAATPLSQYERVQLPTVVQTYSVLHTPLYSLEQCENDKSFLPFSPSADTSLLNDFRERLLVRWASCSKTPTTRQQTLGD